MKKKIKIGLIGILIVIILLVLLNISPLQDQYSYISRTDEMMKVEKIVYPNIFEGFLLKLNIANDRLTLLDSKMANGYPDYFPGSYKFVARIYSFDDELLGEYGFTDPRIIQGELGYTGPTWRDNVNFTLIVPYFNNSKSVNIYSANMLLILVKIPNI